MRVWISAWVLALLVAGPVVAEGGDANAARGIVAEHCVACHKVPGYSPENGTPAVVAPDFQTIADAPDVYTATRLRVFLRQPHFPMQGLNFSAADIDNLIAFITGLRRP